MINHSRLAAVKSRTTGFIILYFKQTVPHFQFQGTLDICLFCINFGVGFPCSVYMNVCSIIFLVYHSNTRIIWKGVNSKRGPLPLQPGVLYQRADTPLMKVQLYLSSIDEQPHLLHIPVPFPHLTLCNPNTVPSPLLILCHLISYYCAIPSPITVPHISYPCVIPCSITVPSHIPLPYNCAISSPNTLPYHLLTLCLPIS